MHEVGAWSAQETLVPIEAHEQDSELTQVCRLAYDRTL